VLEPRFAVRSLLAAVAALMLAAPASATTLVRRGLDRLTAENETIVEAKVLDIHSYWNAAHTFIFTDVHARPSQTMKGTPATDVDFTVMGGTVDGTTVLIVGGPELEPGSDYVLFLGRGGLPGPQERLTVRDLSQGVFVVDHGRAFSQARSEPLLPDAQGRADVPGGDDGLALDTLMRLIHDVR